MVMRLEEPALALQGLAGISEDERDFETVDGIEVELPPTSAESVGIATELVGKLYIYGVANKIGKPYGEVKIALPGERDIRRKPDLIFVPFTAWPAHLRLPKVDAWRILPDLCVEVVSPTDLFFTYDDKLDEYFAAGVKQVWIISPGNSIFRIHEPGDCVRVLRRKDTLSGIDFLPGFELPLSELLLDAAPRSDLTAALTAAPSPRSPSSGR